MSRVEINAGGRHIIVDHDGDLADLTEAAHKLWERAETPLPSPGPAVGFSSNLAGQWDHDRQRPVRA